MKNDNETVMPSDPFVAAKQQVIAALVSSFNCFQTGENGSNRYAIDIANLVPSLHTATLAAEKRIKQTLSETPPQVAQLTNSLCDLCGITPLNVLMEKLASQSSQLQSSTADNKGKRPMP